MPYAGSAAARREDRGLAAVARVRGVAEQRSLRELQQALAGRDTCRREVEDLQQQLLTGASLEAELLGPGSDPGTLLTLRMTLGQLADSTRLARSRLAHAEAVVDAARARWEGDKGRLAAVEQLLERRSAERAVQARRAEDRQTDETAAQGWLRRTTRDH
jgi:flagellar export protein FliJ